MRAQGRLQTTEIAGRISQVGFRDLDVMQPHDRVDVDWTQLGALPDRLAVQLAVIGDVDDEIARNARLAAEPPAGRQRPVLVDIELFDLAPRRDVIARRNHPALGEFAFGDFDLAASADAASATH